MKDGTQVHVENKMNAFASKVHHTKYILHLPRSLQKYEEYTLRNGRVLGVCDIFCTFRETNSIVTIVRQMNLHYLWNKVRVNRVMRLVFKHVE